MGRLTIQEKAEIIEDFKKNVLDQKSIQEKYCINEIQFNYLMKNQTQILRLRYSTTKKPNTHEELEKCLFDWILERQQQYLFVDEKMIHEKASELHFKLYERTLRCPSRSKKCFSNKYYLTMTARLLLGSKKTSILATWKQRASDLMSKRSHEKSKKIENRENQENKGTQMSTLAVNQLLQGKYLMKI